MSKAPTQEIQWQHWNAVYSQAMSKVQNRSILDYDAKKDLARDLTLEFLEKGHLQKAIDAYDPTHSDNPDRQRSLKKYINQKFDWFYVDQLRKQPDVSVISMSKLQEELKGTSSDTYSSSDDEDGGERYTEFEIELAHPEAEYEVEQTKAAFIETLSDYEAAIFKLHIEGASPKDIAEALGKTANSVSVAKNKVLIKAEKFFKEFLTNGSPKNKTGLTDYISSVTGKKLTRAKLSRVSKAEHSSVKARRKPGLVRILTQEEVDQQWPQELTATWFTPEEWKGACQGKSLDRYKWLPRSGGAPELGAKPGVLTREQLTKGKGSVHKVTSL